MSGRSSGVVRPVLWLVVALVLLAAPTAYAAPKGVVDTIGDGGDLQSPLGVAVNESTGDVYVVDSQASTVRRYSADGTPEETIGAQGSGNGQMFSPKGVAVDQTDGSVWVTDPGNNRVVRFDSLAGVHPFGIALGWDVIDGGGTGFEVCTASDTCKAGAMGSGDGQIGGFFFTNQGGLAFDQVNDAIYVADPDNNRIQRFDAATGAFEVAFGTGIFGSMSPSRLAVDSTGGVYVVDSGNDRVLRCYSVGGTPEEFFCSNFAPDQLKGVEAFDVAVDANDHVYVAARPPVPGLYGPDVPIEIIELEPDGDVVDFHGRGDGITHPGFNMNGASGLAVNSNTGAIYLTIAGFGEENLVLVFNDTSGVGTPTADVDPPTGVDNDSATVSGTIDPNGAPTSYQFQYRIGTAQWTRVPDSPSLVGSAAGGVPVSETLTGLQQNTTYQVRLAAVRPYGPGDTISDVETFTTDGVPPEVSAQRATAGDTSAVLEARIDANNSPTTYHFEYGLDASYGQETPQRDGGEGSDPVRRVERITGLQPNTTYHYHVVATNESGTTEGPDRTFTTDATGSAPDGRAYELVTPAGGVADMRPNNGGWRPSTPNGNHVCIGSAFDINGSDPSGGTQTDDAYCAHRGADGWSIEWVAQPRGGPLPPISPIIGASVRWMTDDGERKIWTSDIKGVVPERPKAHDDGFEGYLRAGGQTKWVTPVSPIVREYRHPLAASKDLSHVVYHSGGAVWEWTESEGARRVSVAEDGTPAFGQTNTQGTGVYQSGFWALPTTISDDGSRIFFESDDPLVADDAASTDVYVREDGETTRLLSERRGPASTLPATFAGASEDGEVAYIQTNGQLTADDIEGTALYRYTLATDALQLVEDGIDGALAVSADGSAIVFFGTNVVSASDGFSLYVNRSGTTTRIAPLAPGDASLHFGAEHRVGPPNHTTRALRLTADGSVIVFRAESDTGVVGVHRWDASEGLKTVSQDDEGNPVPADFGNRGTTVANIDINAGRGMTDDGETVFFETEETLDPRDVNGARDVYAWNDGDVRLISPGADHDGDARYLDNSADGTTVFFTTRERILSRQDTNTARDLYAARVGGGFPQPPPSTVGDPPPPPSDGPPPPPPAGNTEGAGDQVADARPTLSAPRPKAAALRAAARSGRLPLRFTLTGGGKVRVRVTATIRGKSRVVATGSRTVRRARRTTATVALRLSAAARRELRRRGRLRLRITVSGSRVLEGVQMTVVLRRSKGGR